jgi:hypothetical protein
MAPTAMAILTRGKGRAGLRRDYDSAWNRPGTVASYSDAEQDRRIRTNWRGCEPDDQTERNFQHARVLRRLFSGLRRRCFLTVHPL